MAFLFASLALLVFGIFAQILCEAMGYDRCLFKYLLSLVPTAFTFFLLYSAVVLFPDAVTVFRFILSLLLGVTILWTVFSVGSLQTLIFRKTSLLYINLCLDIPQGGSSESAGQIRFDG